MIFYDKVCAIRDILKITKLRVICIMCKLKVDFVCPGGGGVIIGEIYNWFVYVVYHLEQFAGYYIFW